MIEVNKFKLGLFVIATVALLTAVVFMLGVRERFAPKGKLVTFFSESVQGIDIGSAVKYKGVPIGRVSAIFIDTKDKKIRVDMDVDLRSFTVSNQGNAMMGMTAFNDFFRNERALGLRCRMDYSGLTGLKYIELDYFDEPTPGEAKLAIPKFEDIPGRMVIPSIPSTLTGILGKLNRSLEAISAIDFEGISNHLVKSLEDVSGILGDERLKTSLARLDTISANLEKVSSGMAESLTAENVNALMSDLKSTLAEINRLSTGLERQVADAKLGDTGQSIRNSARAFEDFQRDAAITAGKLNNALDVLTELAGYLNDDPSSLLTGKNRRPLE